MQLTFGLTTAAILAQLLVHASISAAQYGHGRGLERRDLLNLLIELEAREWLEELSGRSIPKRCRVVKGSGRGPCDVNACAGFWITCMDDSCETVPDELHPDFPEECRNCICLRDGAACRFARARARAHLIRRAD
ncbi:hypothetical protein CC1G_10011 [Coprinopsis cinerea okayama7|uniref:Uncharacterized protein n=1 Tax=Coprinopsis cinerea (strain Okayama-7 / 130 / ATCC MYA-4618 / FGSC 9003) TaxID=240176 RepID=A8NDK8_COPC7|nr:hypothetical protein CC1G_10011 [Coprinopsis cinerea okayama7\|eukprot:XP_001832797.1 hypothetical protein CC1G_10011 [Coprinopsis cinerea okayama7\